MAPKKGSTKPSKRVTVRDREVFLEALSQGLTVRDASRLACHPPTTFDSVRRRDPVFGEAVLAAMAVGTDVLERAAFDRGVHGVLKPIIGKVEPGIDGHLVDANGEPMYETVYSDKLLEVLLKGRRPEYRESRGVEITNQTLNVTVEDRSAALSEVARVLAEAGVDVGAITDGGSGVGEVVSDSRLLLAESE